MKFRNLFLVSMLILCVASLAFAQPSEPGKPDRAERAGELYDSLKSASIANQDTLGNEESGITDIFKNIHPMEISPEILAKIIEIGHSYYSSENPEGGFPHLIACGEGIYFWKSDEDNQLEGAWGFDWLTQFDQKGNIVIYMTVSLYDTDVGSVYRKGWEIDTEDVEYNQYGETFFVSDDGYWQRTYYANNKTECNRQDLAGAIAEELDEFQIFKDIKVHVLLGSD